MQPIISNDVFKPLCDLLNIDSERIITMSVHLAIGEPVVVETTLYAERKPDLAID